MKKLFVLFALGVSVIVPSQAMMHREGEQIDLDKVTMLQQEAIRILDQVTPDHGTRGPDQFNLQFVLTGSRIFGSAPKYWWPEVAEVFAALGDHAARELLVGGICIVYGWGYSLPMPGLRSTQSLRSLSMNFAAIDSIMSNANFGSAELESLFETLTSLFHDSYSAVTTMSPWAFEMHHVVASGVWAMYRLKQNAHAQLMEGTFQPSPIVVRLLDFLTGTCLPLLSFTLGQAARYLPTQAAVTYSPQEASN
jgi:hypothetical protein